MITVACVWTGDKYPIHYVTKLRNMVARHLSVKHEFVCITDRPDDLPSDMAYVVTDFPGWWGKMELFNPYMLGRQRFTIYIDLDTVVLGSLDPLANVARQSDFSICSNFTAAAGLSSGGCAYGSAVMTFAPGFGLNIWAACCRSDHNGYPLGDQQFIEAMYPNAIKLQSMLPRGYFTHWRDFTFNKPAGALAIFAGAITPENVSYEWTRENWR